VAIALLAALAVALLVRVPGAGAATKTVSLGSNGPTPQTITINRGDRVSFVNNDNGSHTITSNAGGWSFRATIQPGARATTPAFTTAGRFGYSDVFFITVVQQSVNGFIEVKATAPSPTPKPTASRTPSPSAKPSATKSPTPRPSATPSSSGVAIGPGLVLGTVPPLVVPSGPAPNVAPPETLGTSTPATTLAYGPKSAIVQSSSHRYGLPVLLALLAVVGVLSLLVRLLLAEPAGRRTPVDREES